MATSEQDTNKPRRKKGRRIRRKKTTIGGGDPIVITGGSMSVTFNPPFNDENTNRSATAVRVKGANNPNTKMTITGVDVTDLKGNLLLSYSLPDELEGKCVIYITAQS